MAIAKPGDDGRRRYAGYGDLTRFDATRTVRSGDFVHQELSGTGAGEEHTVLSETGERVRCRRCSATDTVRVVARPGAARSVRTAERVSGRA
ncbi:hypothetical protein [Nocardiopsis xinjiangensis]|uniref:hypothetical protein n=1 Tax=Nocardiopsis xinjiangensis TaxID=124285 RepID=UPI00034A9576|nr:hypothetical protein [Nocardiopsis xinjiangensis]